MEGAPQAASGIHEAALLGAPRRRLDRHSVVYAEGDPPDHVAFVHEGLVKLVTSGSDGASSLIAFRGPGEWLGEHAALDGLPRSTTAVVVREATITTVERSVFVERLRDHPGLAMALLTSLAGHVRASTGHVLALASGDPEALVARRLQTLASDPRFESTRTTSVAGVVTVDMPISHDDLATWAGVSRRSVEGALRRLRSAGIVRTGRMQLVVEDLAGLTRRTRGEVDPAAECR